MLRNLAASLLILTLIGCGSGGGVSSGGVDGGGGGDGGNGGGGVVDGGGDTPGLELPPGGFPDSGFAGGGSGLPSLINISVAGVPAGTGLRGTTDYSVGVGPGNISEVQVNVTNATSVQFIAQDGTARLAGSVLLGADTVLVGTISPSTGPQQTSAVYRDNAINAMPYPTSANDPEIVEGSDYRYQINSTGGIGSTITGTVVAKNDFTPFSGTLRVTVYLVGSIAQSSGTRTAVNDAIDIWRQIYGAAGISLDTTVQDIASGTGILPAPDVGALLYATNAAAARPYTLNLYIGNGISQTSDTSPGNTFPNELLGIAPGIPGAAVPTIKTAVALNILPHAGVDGIFSNSEVELLGSTMAHEAGHYLGLFHTVEFVGDQNNLYVAGDLFIDTASCNTTTECISNGAAGNLMFPAAIPGQNEQRDLSLAQRAVLNLQVLVD